MKHDVRVQLTSRVVEPDGQSREVRHSYDGSWYRQPAGDYLVYLDEGIHTTLRWEPGELRLYRRGEQLESYQIFRPGRALDFDLSIAGSKLALTALTHDIAAETGPDGGQIVLGYSLASGPTDLGRFTLTIEMAIMGTPG